MLKFDNLHDVAVHFKRNAILKISCDNHRKNTSKNYLSKNRLNHFYIVAQKSENIKSFLIFYAFLLRFQPISMSSFGLFVISTGPFSVICTISSIRTPYFPFR